MNWEDLRKHYAVLEKGAYLMNAAIAGVHIRVRDKMVEVCDLTYTMGAIEDEKYFEMLVEARDTVSSFLNVSVDEIAFGPNSSQNMNVLALMLKTKTEKRHILVPADEFPSSVLAWHHHGFEVELIQSNKGVITPDDFLSRLRPDTAAVVTSAVQFLTGYKIDLEAIGTGLVDKDIDFIVNATQLLGAFPLDIEKARISAMTSSCHKWLGSGIGQSILYVSKEFKKQSEWPCVGWASVEDPWELSVENPIVREDAFATQPGSLPFINIAAISESIKVIQEIGQEAISKRILELSDYLEVSLKNAGATINSPRELEQYKTGILNFGWPGVDNIVETLEKLAKQKVFINGRRGTLRASVHFYNSKEDVDKLLTALKTL